MASVTQGPNTSAKGGQVFSNVLPAMSEEVISAKVPRSWSELPENILLLIFDDLAKEPELGVRNVSRVGRVCKTWHRIAQELLLGDTAASRPKRPIPPVSEANDNKTTLTTKGELVRESTVNSGSEAEACSKRLRLDSFSQCIIQAQTMPGDTSVRAPIPQEDNHTVDCGSLGSAHPRAPAYEADGQTSLHAHKSVTALATEQGVSDQGLENGDAQTMSFKGPADLSAGIANTGNPIEEASCQQKESEKNMEPPGAVLDGVFRSLVSKCLSPAMVTRTTSAET